MGIDIKEESTVLVGTSNSVAEQQSRSIRSSHEKRIVCWLKEFSHYRTSRGIIIHRSRSLVEALIIRGREIEDKQAWKSSGRKRSSSRKIFHRWRDWTTNPRNRSLRIQGVRSHRRWCDWINILGRLRHTRRLSERLTKSGRIEIVIGLSDKRQGFSEEIHEKKQGTIARRLMQQQVGWLVIWN